MLKVKDLTVAIESKTILHALNLSLAVGKLYAIMGPNGSGKSTLAGAVMGSPTYTITPKSKIIFAGEEIQKLKPDERAKRGMFLSFQSPLALSGVTVFQLLRYALDGKVDPLELKRQVEAEADKLGISRELLGRSLNEGFSGGERKKMEVLQAAMLQPKLAFFDEIDTGVDVDALKVIAARLQALRQPDRTFVVITHYNRILKYLQPDHVLIMKSGRIVQKGGKELAVAVEQEGYDNAHAVLF